ncbi:MAG: hypothetical protein Q8N88_07330 [Nanoarchaeota archaeon]|nr:hypothetical protein [Nanoarchaeota archaeon]
MKFNTKLSLKQFQGIFFFILGLVMIFFIYNYPQTYKIWLFLFSILFIIHGITIIFEGTRQRYKIKHIYKKNNYDSKSEEKIAEYFKKKNIIFEHHPRIKMPKKFFWNFNLPFHNIELEPDFYLPEFNIFVEYWGMIDDENYKKNSYDFKKKLYAENDVELIDLYPKNLQENHLDWAFTSKLLEIFKRREGIDRNWR